jgi:Ribbon-helix-helix domain
LGTLNIVLPDELEKRLRVAIAQKGGKKGDLSGSVEEAIVQWLRTLDEEPARKERRK